MDLVEATTKIADVVLTVMEWIDKINKTIEQFVKDINKRLEDLENLINTAATDSVYWLEKQIDKRTSGIRGCLKDLEDKINGMVEDLEDWYDTTTTNIKKGVVTAAFIKINGDRPSDEQAEVLASVIPVPSIKSLLPEFSIALPLPDLSDLAAAGHVSLPRLEI